jgi:hypothetical protein
MWLRRAEPKFTTLRARLVEREEEEPVATGSGAQRVTVPPHMPRNGDRSELPARQKTITVLADTACLVYSRIVTEPKSRSRNRYSTASTIASRDPLRRRRRNGSFGTFANFHRKGSCTL